MGFCSLAPSKSIRGHDLGGAAKDRGGVRWHDLTTAPRFWTLDLGLFQHGFGVKVWEFRRLNRLILLVPLTLLESLENEMAGIGGGGRVLCVIPRT